MGHEELDVARGPEVADACAAEVADEAHVGDNEACDDDQDEGRRPGWNLVGSDAGSGELGSGSAMLREDVPEGGVGLVRLHDFG